MLKIRQVLTDVRAFVFLNWKALKGVVVVQMQVGIFRMTEWVALNGIGIIEPGYDVSLAEFHNLCLLHNF